MEKLEICEEVSMILPRDYIKKVFPIQREAEAVHGITESIQNEKAISLKEALQKVSGYFQKIQKPAPTMYSLRSQHSRV